MICPIRSALDWKCNCPFKAKTCCRQFIDDGTYLCEFCPFDVRNGEVFATRMNMQNSKSEFIILEVKLG